MMMTFLDVLNSFDAAPRLTTASPRAPTPVDFGRITLLPHQQAMVHHMRGMESVQEDGSYQTIGVLADPPGSGKSYIMLAVIQHAPRLENTACSW